MRWHAVLLILLLLVPLVTEYRASPSPIYPQLGYNPQHTGLSPWNGPQTSNLYLSVLVSQTNYGVWGKAVDANGVIYVGSDDGNFYAINPDGTIKWTLTGILVKNSFPATPAIGPDGTIYVGSDSSKYLYAINPDGTIKWKYGPINLTCDGIYYFPAVTIGPDGTLYVSATDYYVYAIKPDGTLKWRYGVGSAVYPVAVDPSTGTIYFSSYNKYLYALNPDGTLKWKYLCADAPSIPAIGPDGTVYVGDMYGYVYAIKPDGTLKWRYGQVTYSYYGWTMAAVMQNPAIGPDGTVYVAADCGWLYALNPDGTLKWRFSAVGAPSYAKFSNGLGPVVGKDGTIYMADDTYVYAINPDGTVKWEWSDPNGTPISNLVITNRGLLLVGDYSGYLYALGVPNLPPPSVTVNVDKAVAKPNDVIRVYGTASSPNGPIASVTVSAKSAYGRTSASCTASMVGINWSCTLTIPPSPDPGTYTVYATAKDSWGVSSVAKANFTVLGVPWPTQNGYYHASLSPFVGPKNPNVAWVFKAGPKFSFGSKSLTDEVYASLFMGYVSIADIDVRDDAVYVLSGIRDNANNVYSKSTYDLYIVDPVTLAVRSVIHNMSFSEMERQWGGMLYLIRPRSFRVSSDGTIYAYNMSGVYSYTQTGLLKWSRGYPYVPTFPLGATVTDDAVYILVREYLGYPNWRVTLYALDPSTGGIKWSIPLGDLKLSISCTYDKGCFYIKCSDIVPRIFYRGFNDGTGELGSYIAVSPTGTIYVVVNTTVYAISSNGSVLRQVSLDSGPAIIKAVSPTGTVYVGKYSDLSCASAGYGYGPCNVIKSDGTLTKMNLPCPLYVDEDENMYIELNNSIASYRADGTLRWIIEAPIILTRDLRYMVEPRHNYSFSMLTGIGTIDATIGYVLTKDGLIAGAYPVNFRLGSLSPYNETIPYKLSGYMHFIDVLRQGFLLSPNGKYLYLSIGSLGGPEKGGIHRVPMDLISLAIRDGYLAKPSPVVDFDGTVYIGYYDGNLYAVGPDGKLKWSLHTNDWIVSAPTIGPDGTIYVGSLDGYVYAINSDGSLKWKYNTGGWITASPEVSSNGTVFVGSWGSNNAGGQLYIINSDGTLKAKYKLVARPSSLLLDEEKKAIYIGTWDGLIYTFNYSSSAYRVHTPSHFATSKAYCSLSVLLTPLTRSISPPPNQTQIFVGYGTCPAYFNFSGIEKIDVGAYVSSSPVYYSLGPSLGFSFTGSKAFPSTTTGVWSPTFPQSSYFSARLLAPASSDARGTIYVGDTSGNVYAVNPDGSVKWAIKLGGMVIAPPVVAYDGMYVVALDELAVYKLMDIPPSPKPKISVALAPNYSLWVLLLVAMCVAGFAFASRGKVVLGISFIVVAIAVYYVVLRPFVSLQTLITQAQQLLSNALAQVPLGSILPLIVAVAGIAVLAKVLRR
jgi:outer membrane protein assembly factor BamB